MSNLFLDTPIGKKNIVFGVFLFVLFAVVIGIPLTLNFFGIRVLSDEQYELWKVVHGYGIFLSVINVFLGVSLDGLRLSAGQKDILGWSFIIAGLFGAVGRMSLALLAIYADWHLFASLGEVVFFVIGLAMFIYGWTRKKELVWQSKDTPARSRAGDMGR